MPAKTKINLYVSKILEHISSGRLDDYLEAIVQEANARRRVVHEANTRRNMLSLNELGKTVRIAGRVRPRYLLGLTGIVVERPDTFNPSSTGIIYVDIGKRVRHYGPVVGVPAASLEEQP